MVMDRIITEALNEFEEVDIIETSRADLVKCYQNSYRVAGAGIKVIIGIDADFPYSLPHFFIVDYKELDLMLPHVEADGYICFLEKDNILLDYENPGGIITES